jgi:hypothetical protein
MADRLWSRKFVAERWGKSEKTVQRTGMVFTRIGKTPMYHPKIVLRYEEDHASRISAWKEGVAA